MDATACVAIYAAVLSTAVFVWNVRGTFARIVVDITPGLQTLGGEYKTGYYIGIRNPSAHTVRIDTIWLVYPHRPIKLRDRLGMAIKYRRWHRYEGWLHDGTIFEGVETGLPLSISPRTSHIIFIAGEALEAKMSKYGAKKFAAIAQDALWRNTLSAPYQLD